MSQTQIRLYNTKARAKQVFDPIDAKNVRMYVCGPTVYDRAHLGNARPVLVFDVLNRLLRHVYGADHVTYVRNFTDVDDKINATALARKQAGAEGTLEELVQERTEETIGWYHADMDALGALRPDHEPRATQYIAQMIEMTQGLIDKGFAYAKDGHALFRVRKYAEYGKLSGRSVDDMIAGARVEVAPFKEDPMDFVLWKPSTDDLPGWDSPWGRGRPGWHIECSAMAKALLGDEFDIHGGGNDLQFPHHENEIAQSCCANGTDRMAQVWLHNEMLQVEGKKMSKSLGNFFTVRDLLDQGVPGEVIRFVMLSTHYRKPMDWTEKKREEAEATLRKWARRLSSASDQVEIVAPVESVPAALCDDLNTHLAMTEIGKISRNGTISEFAASLALLGFDPGRIVHRFGENSIVAKSHREEDGSLWINAGLNNTSDLEVLHAGKSLQDLSVLLIELRTKAMQTKDFSEVDRLKTAFIEAGLEVRMSKDGVNLVPGPNFDPSKLEELL